MTAARLLLGSLGVAAAAYGAWLLLVGNDAGRADLVSTALWLAGGVVLHDFALVPLTLLVAWLLAHVVPGADRAPVVAGLVVLGALTLLAVPVLGGWGANADNPTILDRSYVAGWLVVTVVTMMVVLAAVLVRRRRSGGPGARRR